MCAPETVRRQTARQLVRRLTVGCAMTMIASVAGAQIPVGSASSTLAPPSITDVLTSRAPDTLMSEGQMLYDAGRYKEAAASFELAMQRGVTRPHVAAQKVARSYARLGNRKQALRWAEIAELLERNPEGLKRPLQSSLLLKI